MKREIELDFLRGIAILLALGFHFHTELTGTLLLDALSYPGRMLGWVGVDLFFVLSGFLVGGLVFREIKATGQFRAPRFLARRALKIWPVLYAYLALLLVSRRYEWQEFLPQILLHVQNYFDTPLQHLWSLAVEEHFYLGLSLIAALTLQGSASKRRDLGFYFCVLAIFASCPLLRMQGVKNGYTYRYLYIATHFRIDALTCGVMLAHLHTFHRAFFERFANNKLVLLSIVMAGATFLVRYREDLSTIAVFGFSVAYLSSAALLLFCYRNVLILSRSWAVRLIAALGIYSYSLYVYQFVGMRLLEAVAGRLGLTPFSPELEWVLKYATAIAVAVAVTWLLERPTLALRDRFFPATSGSTPSPDALASHHHHLAAHPAHAETEASASVTRVNHESATTRKR